MPFGTITAQTLTYEPRRPGVYERAGLAIGSPSDEFRLSSANSSQKKDKSVAVTRVLGKDVTVNSTTIRKNAVASLTITSAPDTTFTAAELDSLVADINEFVTTATLTRLFSGEI
jgi:hypothetical protein